MLTAEPGFRRKIPRLAAYPSLPARKAGAQCRRHYPLPRHLGSYRGYCGHQAQASSVSVSRLTTTSPDRWWFVVRHKSQVTSRHRPCPLHCIPTRVPAPVLLAPTTVVLPHVPRPGFSPRHYTTRHTRLHFKRLRGSPTSTCKSSPRIPPICIWATHAVPFLPAPASRLPCDSQSSMHAHRRAPLD